MSSLHPTLNRVVRKIGVRRVSDRDVYLEAGRRALERDNGLMILLKHPKLYCAYLRMYPERFGKNRAARALAMCFMAAAVQWKDQ